MFPSLSAAAAAACSPTIRLLLNTNCQSQLLSDQRQSRRHTYKHTTAQYMYQMHVSESNGNEKMKKTHDTNVTFRTNAMIKIYQ